MTPSRRELLAGVGALCGVATSSGRRERRGHTTGRTGGYGPVGSVEVSGARDAAVDGDVVYVAAGDGFAVVSIADPSEPRLLATRRSVATDTDQPLTGIWDVWPWGDRLAVVGPAQPAPDRPSGLALFDVSEPGDPRQVAFHPTDDHIHNAYFADGTVYVTGRDTGQSVVMVDVTDDEPVEVGRWSPLQVDRRWAEVEPPLRSLHDVTVRDGVAYLPYWDAGTWIVDVSDPGEPAALGRVAEYTREQLAGVTGEQAGLVARTPRGADHYAQVDETGDLLLVGRETWAVEDSRGVVGEAGQLVGGASGVDLYDVSDPGAPEQLATIDPPASFDQTTTGWFTTAHNADLRDGRLYTSWYYGGVAIHDVSNPAEPTALARWHDPREASFWTAQAADGTVVASSADLGAAFSGVTETRDAVYLFPDEAGSQPDPPSLTDWPAAQLGPEPDDRPTADWAGASADRVGDSPDGADTGADRTDDTDASGPGLGVGAALAGAGGYLLARHARQLSDSPEE